jgi:adenylosuccinate lyase
MKTTGCSNNLIEKIEKTPGFGLTKEELAEIIKPEQFTGRSKEQTEEFISEHINPLLSKYKELLGVDVNISV